MHALSMIGHCNVSILAHRMLSKDPSRHPGSGDAGGEWERGRGQVTVPDTPQYGIEARRNSKTKTYGKLGLADGSFNLDNWSLLHVRNSPRLFVGCFSGRSNGSKRKWL